MSETQPEPPGHAAEPLPQTVRLWHLAARLRVGRWTLRELVRGLAPGIPETGRPWLSLTRSVQRDLSALARLEAGFVRLPGRPPRYTIQTDTTQPDTIQAPGPDPATLVLWHAAADLLVRRGGGEHHHAALAQVRSLLPERLQLALSAGPADPLQGVLKRREADNLVAAARAWLGGHALRFEYPLAGHPGSAATDSGVATAWQTLTVQPQMIELDLHDLGLQLLGTGVSDSAQTRAQTHTYKLCRMRAVQVLDAEADAPPIGNPDISAPEAPKSEAAGSERRLRFGSGAALRLLEGSYAHLGAPVLGVGGALETRLSGAADLAPELLAALLSFSAGVELLEPEHLLCKASEPV